MNGVAKGQALYRRAKELMPPWGTGLLSKSQDHFLPDNSPAYFQLAQGCAVWDLEGRKYLDFTHNGVGACVLGYADPAVNAAVKQAIDRGTVSSLLCREEVDLAERLLELHPWAAQVRLARGGGEACALAFRLARAATNRPYLIFCSYSGWTDGYLAVNLGDRHGLDDLLLPGLLPAGVPRQLRDTAFGFHYNRLDELEWLIQRRVAKPAAIVIEVVRNVAPAPGFLAGVRGIADRVGAALIVDEVSTGFRLGLGGAHLLPEYGVAPDVAVFSKALGNGFPIAAVIGKRWVMAAAANTFCSSTAWTERVGPVAALATIRRLEETDALARVHAAGVAVQTIWRQEAARQGLEIAVSGIPELAHFEFGYEDGPALRTLFTQAMLDRGFLATNAFYPTFAHREEHLAAYRQAVDEVFGELTDAIATGTVEKRLRGSVALTGFGRLT